MRTLIVRPIPPDIEVFMDVVMTEQVLQNILDNACKYTPEGTAIEIECRMAERGFTCSVRDHGPGLPPQELTKVFDKYARIEKRDSQVAGTGLGLAISKAVMEAQKGWVKAENHPDGGAVFTFCLPQWRSVSTIITEGKTVCSS
jgi:two-component system sensor histidine kinase KdpD